MSLITKINNRVRGVCQFVILATSLGVATASYASNVDSVNEMEFRPPTVEHQRDVTPHPTKRSADVTCLAKAIYYEAGSESAAGKRAVADVVINRSHHNKFPNTVCGVVYQGAAKRRSCQFSWACHTPRPIKASSIAWKDSERIAAKALETPSSSSALFFHNTSARPSWANTKHFVTKIGNHLFYR